jgi:parvulin-like peptidyl-prolyl isomerase
MKRHTRKKAFLAAALLLGLVIGASLLPAHAFMGMGSGGAGSPHGGGAGHGAAPAPGPQNMQVLGHEGNTATVVAKINGTEITMGRLMNSMMEVIMQSGYKGDNLTPEMATSIRKEALQQLALEELAYQRAQSLGITPDPAVVQAKLDAAIKGQGGREALEKTLAGQKKSIDDFTKEITRFLAVKEAIRQEVDAKVTVTDEEIDQTYAANKAQFIIAERVVVTDVVFFLAADDPASKEKVTAVRRKIVDELGNNPGKLTPEGFVVESQLNVSPENRPELYRIARTMETGALSEPLVIDGTLHLLKADLYQPSREIPAAEAKASIAGQMKSSRRNQLLTEWRGNLLKDADIEIVSEMMKE